MRRSNRAAPGPRRHASPIFAPLNESVTFPAGVTTETVTVPIISTAATPGPVEIWLAATTTSPSVQSTSAGGAPRLLASGSPNLGGALQQPERRPTRDHKRSTGDTRQARFGRRARLQQTHGAGECGEYPRLSDPVSAQLRSTTAVLHSWVRPMSETTEYQSFPIAAATYDPSTLTVTLTLKRPVQASKLVPDLQRVPSQRT